MGNNCTGCDFRFVKKIKSNNQPMLKKQCFKCGIHDGNTYKFNDVGGVKKVDLLPLFNDEKLERYYEGQRVKQQQEYNQKKEQWFETANEYYKSDKWKLKRYHVFKRDNYKCKACEINKANEVHHLTYDHFLDEPLFDLISVCTRCHEKITKQDRIRRGEEI